ncbi:type IX secretion system motor protein PorL/GldL [Moheibacter sediminis]|uniref:Gliding motility-associated protein GldL n=1 Tax=Moheibacter sediminis TaxID=1434700 RepID=A0A1W1ZTD7_9FLAO|nr:gliding motility protein GldL [Moheibacter sediminis]SMC51647.1 gliding motility-associated protein GldL [Moheibacter sediminis]
MATKASKKDVILNMVYSLGAAVVIIGALCKINHYSPLGIDGSIILAIGLVVEALIFVVFAFDKPTGDYQWEKAYPELADGSPVARKTAKVVEESDNMSLSQKLDKMLADAKLDASLMERLRAGIDNFGTAVNEINKTTSAAAATQQYGDQLALAANHMESLNALYQVQLESGQKQVELNKQFISEMEASAGGSQKFQQEMEALSASINSLNKVYGGMLSAMKGS